MVRSDTNNSLNLEPTCRVKTAVEAQLLGTHSEARRAALAGLERDPGESLELLDRRQLATRVHFGKKYRRHRGAGSRPKYSTDSPGSQGSISTFAVSSISPARSRNITCKVWRLWRTWIAKS